MPGCRLSKLAGRLSEGTRLEGGAQQGLWPVKPEGEQARTLPITLTTSLTTSPLALASVTVAVGLTVPLTGSNMKDAEFEVTRMPSLSLNAHGCLAFALAGAGAPGVDDVAALAGDGAEAEAHGPAVGHGHAAGELHFRL